MVAEHMEVLAVELAELTITILVIVDLVALLWSAVRDLSFADL
jgi:hypothetical protein